MAARWDKGNAPHQYGFESYIFHNRQRKFLIKKTMVSKYFPPIFFAWVAQWQSSKLLISCAWVRVPSEALNDF